MTRGQGLSPAEQEHSSSLEEAPYISLDNFEEPTNEESKYVLTSPRSLEACSSLGIKVII